jgi:hypothetical protein
MRAVIRAYHAWVLNPSMRSEPLIAMLGILIALGLMMAIFLAAHRYYKTREPRDTPDR